ncbi:MAG: PKD domain-containing protein [Bacteroidales bacterium]|jgi:hypothetical protein|nr:PKD domain-containing protein [Bacteroidales bacterium]
MQKKSFCLSLLCIIVVILHAQSPYIHKIFDFQPAPGQHVNMLPQYQNGNTKEDMIAKVENAISNNNGGLISLGGYGGYVIFGFDHSVQNIAGRYDFQILGNTSITNPTSNPIGSTAEPGIIMVSRDDNSNGIPDDEWYEIAGSEYHNPQTVHDFEITYYKSTAPNKFPKWLTDTVLTFSGKLLPDNVVNEGGIYKLYSYPYGYADNFPNNGTHNLIDIDWAVDNNGNPAHLTQIDFIKVYTGINATHGAIGESSTDIIGAEDLHLTGGDIVNAVEKPISSKQNLIVFQQDDNLHIISPENQKAEIINLNGQIIQSLVLSKGENSFPFPHKAGIYLVKTIHHNLFDYEVNTIKFVNFQFQK